MPTALIALLRRYRLGLFLLAYALLVLYGSLHPFRWHPLATWTPAFLAAPLPHFITRTDLATNLLIYLPLGYALTVYLARYFRLRHMILLGTLGCIVYSLLMESTQVLVPGRNASNLDVTLNGLGGWLGALLSRRHGHWLAWLSRAHGWQVQWFRDGLAAHLGLLLILIWVLAQFSLVPFPGMGWLGLYLRPLDTGLAIARPNWPWGLAIFFEMAALGSFAAAMLRPGRYAGALALLFVVAFLLKVWLAVMFLRFNLLGGILSLETLGGFLGAYWLLMLPPASRHRAATAAALLAAIVLLRLTLAQYLLVPKSNPFNIVGFADLAASLWPYLALGVLGGLAVERMRSR